MVFSSILSNNGPKPKIFLEKKELNTPLNTLTGPVPLSVCLLVFELSEWCMRLIPRACACRYFYFIFCFFLPFESGEYIRCMQVGFVPCHAYTV